MKSITSLPNKSTTRSLISILMVTIILISTIIPQQTYADSGFTPVNGIASAGGSGSSPGAINTTGGNTGRWNDNMQGFRIRVLGVDGTPAFTFMGKDSMDLLFSTSHLDEMTYYGDSNKLGIIRNYQKSRASLNTAILTISKMQGYLNNGTWKTSVADGVNAAGNLNSLPKHLEFAGNKFKKNGEKVRMNLYGSGDKLVDNAKLYTFLNLASKTNKIGEDGKPIYTWLWQPKPGARLMDENFDPDLKAQFDAGKLSAIKLMASQGLIVSVEPIIWNKTRISDGQFRQGVYGTHTDAGWIIADMVNRGELTGEYKNYGGWDIDLFGRTGRKAMVMAGKGFVFPCYRNASGALVYDSWYLDHPNDTGKMVTNKEVGNVQPGWSIHTYLLEPKEKEPETQTKDPNIHSPTPHPAPDPKTIPPLPNEHTRNINIVKTYEADGEHVATYARTENPKKIRIMDEGEYKVVEWFTAEEFTPTIESTTWSQIKSSTNISNPAKNKGTSTSTVKVETPETTLYVKLIKQETPKMSAGIVITESQITKAVETADTSIIGWGPKTMNFNYQSLQGNCDYIVGYTSITHSPIYCRQAFVIKDKDWSYHFKNSKPISEIIQANRGTFVALNTRGDDAEGERSNISSGTDQVNSFNYQAVLWRGKDIPTLASYKENESHPLQILLSRYGRQPAGSRFTGKQYYDNFTSNLTKNGGLGDYNTNSRCPEHSSKGLKSTAENGNDLIYGADVEVQSYIGVAHKPGDAKTADTGNIFTALVSRGMQAKYSGGTVVGAPNPIKFYPYIRMTYQVPAEKDTSRTNVNVLSQFISELHPSSFAEAGWSSTQDINLSLNSTQWSVHQRATNGDKGWNTRNNVLPGGAILNLDTKNQKTYVSVVTWQPYLEEEIASKVIVDGAAPYTLAATKEPHTNLVTQSRKAVDNWRVVQYVEKNPTASTAFNGTKITGEPGQSLSSLGLPSKTNKETKYYLKKSNAGNITDEGDLDIIAEQSTEIHYKVKSDVEGNVYVQRKRDGSDWTTIDTIPKAGDISSLSNESKELDNRTKIITNLLTVITRNKGDDKTASWAKTDGKWFNEAFDGICYIRQETSFDVGFRETPVRSSVLDPALTPVNKGQSDLFSNAFLSQYRMNDKSDAYQGEATNFIGKFKGQDVILNGADNMYKSRTFNIPNVNVQDLN